MAKEYKNFQKGIGLVAKSSSGNNTLGDLEVLISTGKIQFRNATDSSPIVTETHASQGANRLKNKDLEDATTAIVDATDPTKKIKFDAQGNTGTTTTLLSSQTVNRTITLPNATDTLVARDTQDTLTNKTLSSPILTAPTINSGASLTTTSTVLNYLSSATGTEGTTSSKIVFSTSPTLTTPSLTSPSANEYIIKNSISDTITLSKQSGSSIYTISLPASAPTSNTSLIYNGSNYVWGEPGKAPTITVLTSSTGIYNPPTNVKYIKIRMVGAGGGGGGASSSGDTAGGGGGSGAYIEAIINAPISSTSYSIGTFGTAGTIANDGGNGGNTTFGSYTANGGAGGSRGTSFGKGAGGSGGTTSSLPIGAIGFSTVGQGGGAGGADDVNGDTGGIGGGSLLGGGAKATGVGAAGQDATANSGGGGSGGGASGSAGTAGGKGASGIIIIEEYYNY